MGLTWCSVLVELLWTAPLTCFSVETDLSSNRSNACVSVLSTLCSKSPAPAASEWFLYMPCKRLTAKRQAREKQSTPIMTTMLSRRIHLRQSDPMIEEEKRGWRMGLSAQPRAYIHFA